MGRLLSGRVGVTSYSGLSTFRKQTDGFPSFLGLEETEPNLGLPGNNDYMLMGDINGTRRWEEKYFTGIGTINGLDVQIEGVTPTGFAGSVTKFNFTGNQVNVVQTKQTYSGNEIGVATITLNRSPFDCQDIAGFTRATGVTTFQIGYGLSFRESPVGQPNSGIVSVFAETSGKIQTQDSTGNAAFPEISTLRIGAGLTITQPAIGIASISPTGNFTNLNVSGISTLGAAEGVFTGALSGNVTGNLTGNVTGNVTGDLTGNSNGTHTGGVVGNITGDINSTGVSTISQLQAGTINASGIVTAMSFKGPLHSAGISTAIILKSDNVDATGIITAAGGFVGNITGDVTGKVTGDLYSVGFSTASIFDAVRIVVTDQLQVDGVKSTGIITATTFDGVFAGAASSITVATESSDTTNYVVFVNDVNGDYAAKVNTALRYDAQNSTLHATEFAGSGLSLTNIPGSSITGTLNATTVTLTETSTTNATHYITFADSLSGNEAIRTDTSLQYNPSTNTLTAATFAGDATGLTGTPSISVADITAAGNIIPSAHSTYNLGSNAVRWNNIYTMDMHFSNKGSQNDIDGTWGDWTLQEGDENIFMKNNRTGKKFKINLTEV
tara:strand:+ start:5474 stop:7306 length:1833 start_codon:yes stop_codon:yes gene_type:complete